MWKLPRELCVRLESAAGPRARLAAARRRRERWDAGARPCTGRPMRCRRRCSTPRSGTAVLFGHSDGASIACSTRRASTVAALVQAGLHFSSSRSRSPASCRRGGATRAQHPRSGSAATTTTPFGILGLNDIWLDPEFAGWSIVDEGRRLAVPYGGPARRRVRHAGSKPRHRAAPGARFAQCPDRHSPHRDQPGGSSASLGSQPTRLIDVKFSTLNVLLSAVAQVRQVPVRTIPDG